MKKYELTEEQYNKLMDACKPVPYLVVGGVTPRSPQENANMAWKSLGKELGFNHMTVKPIHGKSDRFFIAESHE